MVTKVWTGHPVPMGMISRAVAALSAAALSSTLLVATSPAADGGQAAPRAAACSHGLHGWFVPTRAEVGGIGTNIAVLALARKANGQMSSPPLTTSGKAKFAWDKQSTPPGYFKGSVPLNAHTYPDGSALGNKLQKQLFAGERIALKGNAGEKLCYKIDSRTKYKVADVPWRRLTRTDGSPQVAIIVCSGKRLGPGNWTHRTVWFGHPIA